MRKPTPQTAGTTPRRLRAVGYVRVSTDQQAQEGVSLEAQHVRIRAHCVSQQIELVDITPEALRRRLSHGNVYAPERVDAALSNYFRQGNLTALHMRISGQSILAGVFGFAILVLTFGTYSAVAGGVALAMAFAQARARLVDARDGFGQIGDLAVAVFATLVDDRNASAASFSNAAIQEVLRQVERLGEGGRKPLFGDRHARSISKSAGAGGVTAACALCHAAAHVCVRRKSRVRRGARGARSLRRTGLCR